MKLDMKLTEKHKSLLTKFTQRTHIYGLPIDVRTSSHWPKLEKEGYVEIKSGHVRITDKGREAIKAV